MLKPLSLVLLLSVCGIMAQAANPAASSVTASADETIFAEVDGVQLTLADYEKKYPTGLFQARNAFYQAHRKAADQFIDDFLLERQAKKEGLTVDQLMEKHVTNIASKDPSDEVLRAFYDATDTPDTFEKVKPQLISALRDRRIQKAKTNYIQSLRTDAKVIMRVGPPRAQLNMKDIPVRGNPNAKIMIIEVADYECPYCQNVRPEIQKVLEDNKDTVSFAFKDMPLPMHANAAKAAEAAACAKQQGKYWEYHDALFETKQLAVPQLKQHAATLKLDTQAFNQCLDSGAQANFIKSQFTEAANYGLQGTPAFFVNGRFFSGGMSAEDFKKIIQEELSRKPVNQATASR